MMTNTNIRNNRDTDADGLCVWARFLLILYLLLTMGRVRYKINGIPITNTNNDSAIFFTASMPTVVIL